MKKHSLDELYNNLKRFHLSDSLHVIGAINSEFKYNYEIKDNKNIPAWKLEWFNKVGNTPRERKSLSLNLTRMARFLILSSSNDYKSLKLDVINKSVRKAYDLVVNLDDHDDEIALNNWGLYFNRIGQIQFPLQANKKRIIGRGYLLFHELVLSQPSDYDFEGKFKEYFNLSILDFLSAGFILWTLSDGTLDNALVNDIPQLEQISKIENRELFLSLSCGTPRRYRELVRGEDWKVSHKLKDLYAMEPFMIMPAIAVERSTKLCSSTYLVPQPKYLLDRASSGVFYLLGDKEMEIAKVEDKKRKNPFREAFGMIYRSYVGKQLAITSNNVFVDLDNDFSATGKGQKIPDFALIQNEICVLFEVKISLLDVDSRSYFERENLERALRGGNIKTAVKQLTDFRDRLLLGEINDTRFFNVKRVICIVVGYEDIFSLNSTLLPMLDNQDEVYRDLQFASISDIDEIGCAISQSIDVVNVLQRKVTDTTLRLWAIRTLLSEKLNHEDNLVLDKAFEDFIINIGFPYKKSDL